MTRIRPFLTLAFLALIAPAAMGQEQGSHKHIREWNEGGVSRARAAEMAKQLKAAGITPPSAGQPEPETIKRLLEMLERNPDLLKRAMERDNGFRDQIERLRPEDPELRKQLEQRDPRQNE